MQIVDILCYHCNIKIFFEFGEPYMCGIWLRIGNISSSFIVKVQYQLRITLPRARRGNILNIVSFPQPIAVAECS